MDQLKKVLVAVRKYHFWVLGAVVVVLLLIFWSTASAKLSKDYETQKTSISGHFTNMSTLAGAVDPPNQVVIDVLVKVHEGLKQNVLDAWKYLYEEQRKNNPVPGVLGENFKTIWDSLRPDEELPFNMRDTYWYFIRDYFPKLLERVDIRRPKNPELAGGAGGPGMRGMPGVPGMMEGVGGGNQAVEYIGKVVWDKTNYDQLLRRFDWRERPTSKEIRLAQEDLWVYETLLNIIKDLNKDSTSHYNAAVKRIRAVDIGRDATKAFHESRNSLGLASLQPAPAAAAPGAAPTTGPGAMGQPMPPGSMSPGPMGPGAMPPGGPGMMEVPMAMQPGMMEGPMMMPGAGLPLTADFLMAYRYVDQNEQPVPLENGVPKQPYSEFRMMPIHMSLLMDQRKIPELMVKCANSNMPIELRQIRLAPGKTAKVNYGAAAGGGAGSVGYTPGMMEGPGMMGPGMEGPMDQGGMDEGPGMGGPGMGAEEGAYRGPYDVPVDILGIIYIYEPPDKAKLGTGTASTGEAPPPVTPPPAIPGTTPAVPGTTPGATPAETPGTTPGTTPATPPTETPATPPAGVPPGPVAPPTTPPAAVPVEPAAKG